MRTAASIFMWLRIIAESNASFSIRRAENRATFSGSNPSKARRYYCLTDDKSFIFVTIQSEMGYGCSETDFSSSVLRATFLSVSPHPTKARKSNPFYRSAGATHSGKLGGSIRVNDFRNGINVFASPQPGVGPSAKRFFHQLENCPAILVMTLTHAKRPI